MVGFTECFLFSWFFGFTEFGFICLLFLVLIVLLFSSFVGFLVLLSLLFYCDFSLLGFFLVLMGSLVWVGFLNWLFGFGVLFFWFRWFFGMFL